jgi:hypothetical protein
MDKEDVIAILQKLPNKEVWFQLPDNSGEMHEVISIDILEGVICFHCADLESQTKGKQEDTRLTKKQHDSMLLAAKPLIQWINQNCHPHCVAQVDSTVVELLEGVATGRTKEFLND